MPVPRFGGSWGVTLAVFLTTVSVYACGSGHFLSPPSASAQESCGDVVHGHTLPSQQGSLQDEEAFVQTALYTNSHVPLASGRGDKGWSLADFWHDSAEGSMSSKAVAEMHRYRESLKGLTLHAVNVTATLGHTGVSWLQRKLASRRIKSTAPLIAAVVSAAVVIVIALAIFCISRAGEPTREEMEENFVNSYLHQVSTRPKHDKGDRGSLLGKQSLLPVHKRSLPENSLRQQAGAQWQKELLHDNVPASAHAEPPSAVQHARESSREKYHPISSEAQHPGDFHRDRTHPSSSEVTSARDSAREPGRDQHPPVGSGALSEARLSDARLSREGPGLAQALLGVKSSPLPPAPNASAGLQKPASSSPQLQRGNVPPGRAIVPPLCSSLVLPVCEGYFAVSVPELAELDETGGGSLDIVGLTGNRLLRATARGVPMKCALEIFMTHSGSAPRASIKPATGSQSSGTLPLEIRGTGGGLYGVLEARTASCYVVKAKHRDVMAICGASDSLDLTVNVGEQVVADTKCNSDNFGGVPHLEIRVEPGVDPILILSCILAVVLQSTPKDLLTKCSSP